MPFAQLPFSKNTQRGFYNSSNNDVVPKIVPGYKIPLGYEYSAPYRYERAFEVLSRAGPFALADMERLQQDATSLPARALVPLLRQVRLRPPSTVTANAGPSSLGRTPMAGLTIGNQPSDPAPSADAATAIGQLVAWNHVLDKTSTAATIFEYWFLRLQPLAYGPHVPEAQRATFRAFDPRRVIAWMTQPDAAYGANKLQRDTARNRILVEAMEQAVADLRKAHGDKWADIPWGQIHSARFTHPLAGSVATRDLFTIPAVPKSGDAYTCWPAPRPPRAAPTRRQARPTRSSSTSRTGTTRPGSMPPGNRRSRSARTTAIWRRYGARARYVPMTFSRAKVDAMTTSKLMLQPAP